MADIIAHAVGKPEAWMHGNTHPATKSFQALRIFINDELGQLRQGLIHAEHLLLPRGICAVVSFHSLEDRLAKKFFRGCQERVATEKQEQGFKSGPSASQLRKAHARMTRQESEVDWDAPPPTLTLAEENPLGSFYVHGRVIKPSAQEIQDNPRSRSAKLRLAWRTSALPVHLS